MVLLAPEGVNGLAVFAGVLEGLAQIVKCLKVVWPHANSLLKPVLGLIWLVEVPIADESEIVRAQSQPVHVSGRSLPKRCDCVPILRRGLAEVACLVQTEGLLYL